MLRYGLWCLAASIGLLALAVVLVFAGVISMGPCTATSGFIFFYFAIPATALVGLILVACCAIVRLVRKVRPQSTTSES